MKNHENEDDYKETEGEEVPDEFLCCVCLDLIYKPVVLACGHLSCFWCVYKAMDPFQESQCPMCRNPYNYFPRVCESLHLLILKLFPSAYRRRERQVAEEEKKLGHSSPQFEKDLHDSDVNEVFDVREASPLVKADTLESNTIRGDNALKNFPGSDDISIPTSMTSSHAIDEAHCEAKTEETDGTLNQVLAANLQCAVCKLLLCCPVVLNCGHVYCEACIYNQLDGVFECPGCQSPHPNGFPNVCLILEHILEERFPDEYSSRKKTSASSQKASTSRSSTEKLDPLAQSSVAAGVYLSWRSGHGAKVHPMVGCDCCGMYPIIGQRYKCKDCTEKIGFDLCEKCYTTSSKTPGRFNQQHTQEHKFVVIRPPHLHNLILSLGAEYYEEGIRTVVVPDNQSRDVPATANSGIVASDHELENPLPGDDSQHQDDETTSDNSS